MNKVELVGMVGMVDIVDNMAMFDTKDNFHMQGEYWPNRMGVQWSQLDVIGPNWPNLPKLMGSIGPDSSILAPIDPNWTRFAQIGLN